MPSHPNDHRLCLGVIDACLLGLFFLMVIGVLLQSGPIDPETHHLRFISDGFQRNRWCAYACVPLMFTALLVFGILAYRIQEQLPPDQGFTLWFATAVSGSFLSFAGFLGLVLREDGPVHYACAILFCASFFVMHIGLFKMTENHDLHVRNKMKETCTVTAFAVACIFLVGCIVLLVAYFATNEGALYTASAACEYGVFVLFIILSWQSLKWIRLTLEVKEGGLKNRYVAMFE